MDNRLSRTMGLIVLSLSSTLFASTTKTEVVEENEKSEVKVFCSKKSEAEANLSCEKWLDQQAKTLGNRLLTKYCSAGEMVSNDSSCLYRATGELKYVLKKFKTETEKSN